MNEAGKFGDRKKQKGILYTWNFYEIFLFIYENPSAKIQVENE